MNKIFILLFLFSINISFTFQATCNYNCRCGSTNCGGGYPWCRSPPFLRGSNNCALPQTTYVIGHFYGTANYLFREEYKKIFNATLLATQQHSLFRHLREYTGFLPELRFGGINFYNWGMIDCDSLPHLSNQQMGLPYINWHFYDTSVVFTQNGQISLTACGGTSILEGVRGGASSDVNVQLGSYTAAAWVNQNLQLVGDCTLFNASTNAQCYSSNFLHETLHLYNDPCSFGWLHDCGCCYNEPWVPPCPNCYEANLPDTCYGAPPRIESTNGYSIQMESMFSAALGQCTTNFVQSASPPALNVNLNVAACCFDGTFT